MESILQYEEEELQELRDKEKKEEELLQFQIKENAEAYVNTLRGKKTLNEKVNCLIGSGISREEAVIIALCDIEVNMAKPEMEELREKYASLKKEIVQRLPQIRKKIEKTKRSIMDYE